MALHPPPFLVPPPMYAVPQSPAGEVNEDLLVDALRAHRAWAERAALERFTAPVRRVLVRILGSPAEIDDLTQEVFLRGLDRIRELRDGVELRSWFISFAVNVAREALRSRARRRWLLFFAPQELPEPAAWFAGGPAAPGVTAEAEAATRADASRALRATYEVLGRMGIAARTAFALRHIDGMDLDDVASACGVSLSTIKRRLDAAEQTFCARARRHPLLQSWIEQGARWGRA